MSFKAPWCKSRSRGRRTHRYTGLCQRQPKGSQNSREKKNTWTTRGGKSGETHPYLPPHARMLRVKSCTCQLSAQLGLRSEDNAGHCQRKDGEWAGHAAGPLHRAPACWDAPSSRRRGFPQSYPAPGQVAFCPGKGAVFPMNPAWRVF